MTSLIVFVQQVARIMGYIGALAVVAMMLHISLDVLLRNLFRYSMDTVPEIVARYYMTAVAFLPLGWLEFRRQMISVEVIEFALTPRLRRLSDASVMAIAALVYGYLAYTNWGKAMKETRVGTLVEIATYKMPPWPAARPAGAGGARPDPRQLWRHLGDDRPASGAGDPREHALQLCCVLDDERGSHVSAHGVRRLSHRRQGAGGGDDRLADERRDR